MADFWVNGIVAQRDNKPYIQLSNEKGMIAQLSMSEARQIAQDMLIMASRTEMDAMVLEFFKKFNLPEETRGAAAAAMMQEFREFRAKLDDEKAERREDPERGKNNG